MANVFDVDSALLATLQADATLTGIATNGIWYGDGPSNATRFVTVTRIDGTPEVEFQDLAWIDLRYQVKCVLQTTSATDVKAAAGRIDALLDGQTLPVATYKVMEISIDTPIRYTEVDAKNPDLRWQHGGGQYLARVIPLS